MVIMSIYRKSVPIKKMRLRCDCSESKSSHEPICDVREWLAAAAVRRIEHLDLQVSQCLSFFNFRDLVVLKLKNSTVVIGATEVYLPSLKTLHMHGVHFHLQSFLVELIDGCPILEDLEAKNISVRYHLHNGGEASVCKYLTNLVRADIGNIYGVRLKALTNAEFLCIELQDQDYDNVPMFPNLTHLELKGDVPLYVLFQVMERFPKLQNLVVEMALPYSTYSISADLQRCVFPKRVLSSEFKRCTITNYNGHTHTQIWLFINVVMKISTSLQRMTICCLPSLDQEQKLEMQNHVLSNPKSSATCEVLFD